MSGFYLPPVWFDKSQQNPWLMPCIEWPWGGFAQVFFHYPISPATFAGTYWPTGHSRRQSHSPPLPLWCCEGGGGSEQPLLLLIWVFRLLAGKTIIPVHGVPPPVTPVSTCMQPDLEQWAGHEWWLGWRGMVTAKWAANPAQKEVQDLKGTQEQVQDGSLGICYVWSGLFPTSTSPLSHVVADSSPGVFWRREVTWRLPSHYLVTLHHKGREYK